MTDIAVIRALALGDMLCSVPTLRALRKRFPDAHIALIGLGWARDLVDRFPDYLDELIEFPGYPGIPEAPVDPARTVAFLSAMQARRFDLVVQLQGNGLVMNEFAALLGGGKLAGFVPRGLEPPRHSAEDVWIPYPAHGSEVDRLLALAAALGAPVERRLEFPIRDDDRRQADGLLAEHGIGEAPLAIVHAGGSRPERRWPADRFASVADELADTGLHLVLTGTAAESEVTAAVAASMRAPSIDLAGRTSLGVMAALVERARVVVTNDTGVSHLAAAIGSDSVTVFSVPERGRWAPVGSERNVSVGDGRPGGAPVSDVLHAVQRLLDG
jgi:ADP-heptose:LPS heptosyltransferase